MEHQDSTELDPPTEAPATFAFSASWREGVYQAIYRRRDVRRFRPDAVPPDVLARVLDAAHHAPSVGFMQPWNFIVIADRQTRAQVLDLYQRERVAAAQFFDEPRRSQYLSLKLEGILEAPINICVTSDPTCAGTAVLGRNSVPETDLYSTCCAVQNLWLAARAEGIGIGWVSILKLPQLRAMLGIPHHVVPVAYLCLGYPEQFMDRPELETSGWRCRQPLASTIFYEAWGRASHPNWPVLDRLVPGAASRRGGNMKRIIDVASRIRPLDEEAMRAARERQDELTKPQGSLGRLEDLAVKVAGITGQLRPRLPRKAVIVLAGDHGVAEEGVSAYPQAVTGQMVQNFLAGGAAINVLARQAGARVVVADLGVATEIPEHPNLVRRKIGYGTRSMTEGPAMSVEEALAAISAGIEIVETEIERGLDLVATGDMGIGNTTASSAIVAAITGRPISDVTGRGTGVDDAGWQRKGAAIERALAVNRPDPADPLDVLAKVGVYEIGGLAGVILGAAARRIPIIIDGFISGAAALIAAELCPLVHNYLIAAHNSFEIGHHVVLERMELGPLLNLNLRLGEGTGAALAMHLVDDALAVLDEMATFREASIAAKV
ncbi:MAG: nicotinate-nucleotide--dimethylbenzimidazole phosphoribosyltransferase [Pseudomonadota bacterium]|nr:nicotinate-nucleotide--dimethylbenzimidazole phosphoribosyltransferase [Chloroflexota bacterium]MDP9414169.1 nicotinate-nucleotide--dimethylbenzimidazole phosphoribosyltransferase [Pseudomonadota bacterium]